MLKHEGGIDFYNDLQQIVDLIIQHQYQEWSGPEGIIPFLDRLHIWHDNDDERIKRFQNLSSDAVKILTLHFSKGLEFDVVFALGLVNRTGIREELIPIEHEGRTTLMPLVEEEKSHQLYFEENDAEKMRQLYVAFTRAKFRLYVPMALNFPSEDLKIGEASPMELFLARFKHMSHSYEELYERIHKPQITPFVDWVEHFGKQNDISYSLHDRIEWIKDEKPLTIYEKELIQPKTVIVPGESAYMTSFSRLVSPLPKQKSVLLSCSLLRMILIVLKEMHIHSLLVLKQDYCCIEF